MTPQLAIGVMGSASGAHAPEVLERCHVLGRTIAERNCTLITGACDQKRDRVQYMRQSICFIGKTAVGGPEKVARTILDLNQKGDLDSVLLVFDDYIKGLTKFEQDVMPLLKERRAAVAV